MRKQKLFNAILICFMTVMAFTLVACKKTVKYKVTFNYNVTSVANKAINVLKDDYAYEIAQIVNNGYEFSGWYANADFSGSTFAFEEEKITGEITLYAKWTKVNKVAFDVNGASVEVSSKQCKAGESVVLPAAPSKDGFAFAGWVKEGQVYAAGASYKVAVDGDVTFTAKWTKENYVNFDVNGADEEVNAKKCLTGESVVLPAAPTKDEFEFVGWAQGGQIYDAGASYKVAVDGDVTFVATWNGLYDVAFYDYDGTLLDTQVVAGGEAAVAPSAGENAPGHLKFVGWDQEFDVVSGHLEVMAVYEYQSASEEYFTFVGYKTSENVITGEITKVETDVEEEIEFYLIGKAEGEVMPSYLALPKEYNGKVVKGFIGDSSAATAMFGNVEAGADSIKTIVIPNTYVEIPNYTFYGNFALEEVIFEEGSVLERIGQYAFAVASKAQVASRPMNSIEIPASVKVIDNYAFAYLVTLNKVTFEEGSVLERIGQYAFALPNSKQDYSGLDGIEIPASVKVIDNYAFAYNGQAYVTFEEGSVLYSIGQYAFAQSGNTRQLDSQTGLPTAGHRQRLTSIEFPAELMTIGNYAFNMNYYLEEISFEGGSLLTSIGNYAFASTTVLEKVSLPVGLETIGTNAFQSSGVVEVKIPYTVSSIGNYAFEKCKNLKDIIFVGTPEGATEVELTIGTYAFAGSTSDYPKYTTVTIPARVVKIDNYAFAQAQYLKKLVIEAGEKDLVIGNYAFAATTASSVSSSTDFYSSQLTEVNIPARVKSLGNYAFVGNVLVTKVVFAEGSKLKEINTYAFGYMPNLTTVTLADGLEVIGVSAFQGYYEGINVYVNGAKYKIYAKNTTLKNVVIPYTVKTVGNNAFYYNAAISSITFTPTPEDVTAVALTIGSNAFYGGSSGLNSSLTTLTIPARCTEIGSGAFRDMSKLTLLTFEPGSQLAKIQTDAFNGATSLASVDLPSSLTLIATRAFQNCTALKVVGFEDNANVELTIGNNAFTNTVIEKFYVPQQLISFDVSSVAGVPVMEFTASENSTKFVAEDSVLYNPGKTAIVAFPGGLAILQPNYVVADSVEEIGDNAFNGSALKSVVTNNVTKIGNYAFSACPQLETADLTGATDLGSYIFALCPVLNDVTIDEEITKLPNYIFQGCKNLKTFEIPADVTTIGDSAFNESGLESIVIPAGVTAIGSSAFRYTNLVNVIIPASVETIGASAFVYCGKLEVVVIEGTITTLGLVFHNCISLKYVTLKGELIPANLYVANLFNYCDAIVAIYVADDKYDVVMDTTTPFSKILGAHVAAGKVGKVSERAPESILVGEAVDEPVVEEPVIVPPIED